MPYGQVELVVDDDDPLERHLVEVAQRRRPGRRTRSCTTAASRARPADRRRAGPRRRRRGALCDLNFAPIRSASRSTTRNPTLCRLPAYAGPGVAEADDEPAVVGHGVGSPASADRRERTSLSSAFSPSASTGTRRLALGCLGGSLLRVGRLVLDADLGLGLGQLGLDAPRRSVGAVTLTTRPPASVTSVTPVGQLDVAGVDLGADLAGPRSRPRSRSGCAWPRPRPRACCARRDAASPGAASPTTWTPDLDADLLAPADEQQVDVLEEALDRVALDVLGDRQLAVPLEVERRAGRSRS